jgi:hypothetical protein
MSDLVIDINSDAYKQEAHAPVRGGGTRVVMAVPTAFGILPVIWTSHDAVLNDQGIRVYPCLLLVSKAPPQVLAGEISVQAFNAKNLPTTAVEW